MIAQKVTLVSTPDNHHLQEAVSVLRSSGLDFELQYCSDKVAEWFLCPFVRDSSGQTYFGIAGIDFFVKSKAAG